MSHRATSHEAIEEERDMEGARPIRSCRGLVAWQMACGLVKKVYDVTKRLPDVERFGLVQQMRRAAISIAAISAEGWGRGARVDDLRSLRMARGSLYEPHTEASLARDPGYGPPEEPLDEPIAEAERVLNGLIRSAERTTAKP